MSSSKPYRSIPILECGEPLVPIAADRLALMEPHPLKVCGAPYGTLSPWMLRASILESLEKAQEALQESSPGWRILLTDALRPVSVQVYMVEHELTKLARAEGLEPDTLTTRQREVLMEKVLRLWAIPSLDPETPPPHSTGAVFDCTLLDETGQEVEMGSPVDENSDRSYPDYFATATDAKGRRAHQNRLYLRDLLRAQGFQRHHTEWWHFSRGDQLAIWLEHGVATDAYAIYGRADLL